MRAHDAFDALAGAVLLGEATPDEIERYRAHATGCERCEPDLGGVRAAVAGALARAGEDETWRPQVRAGVGRAIERHRWAAQRRTANLLFAAIVASIALNAAVGTGLGGRVAGTLRPIIAKVIPFAPIVAARSEAGGVHAP